jgi:hypothetical protein
MRISFVALRKVLILRCLAKRGLDGRRTSVQANRDHLPGPCRDAL